MDTKNIITVIIIILVVGVVGFFCLKMGEDKDTRTPSSYRPFGVSGTNPGQMKAPMGVALDSSGNI